MPDGVRRSEHSSSKREEEPSSRSRSRSPHRRSSPHRRHHRRRDPPSPRHRQHSFNHHSKHKSPDVDSLPLSARPLSKHEFSHYEPMFRLYLDIQKDLILDDLDGEEQKGRWKSFVRKWNRGELAEGWYDPQTLHKARTQQQTSPYASDGHRQKRRRHSPEYGQEAADGRELERPFQGSEEVEEDDFGPALPGQIGGDDNGHGTITAPGGGRRPPGPAIPNMQDLELQRESVLESISQSHNDLRALRKDDVKAQKARLDELIPKAEPGTRDRQLEKKRELADSNRAFAAAKEDPSALDINDNDLMGGGEGIEEVKKMKKEFERKKNERELRREEVLRARAVEREERLAVAREKEERTMEMLRGLARGRFGGAGEGG